VHWAFLALAILLEVAGTTCMKLSAGLTKPGPTVLMGLCYCACFCFLALCLKKVDVSVAYAVWSGVGVALIAAIGIVHFREPLTWLKILGTLAIIGGVIALNLGARAR
jgi:small multidrug resistance pump